MRGRVVVASLLLLGAAGGILVAGCGASKTVGSVVDPVAQATPRPI